MMGFFMAEDQAPAPQDDSSGDGGDSGAMDMLNQVGNGLAALAQQEPAFQPVLELFAKTVDDLKGGGKPAPSDTTTPEQGGNPNAVPMSMGRPG